VPPALTDRDRTTDACAVLARQITGALVHLRADSGAAPDTWDKCRLGLNDMGDCTVGPDPHRPVDIGRSTWVKS
jgi:hypothetical protein